MKNVGGSTDVHGRLLDLLGRIPHGRVVGHSLLAHELDIAVRHVMALVLQLEPAERDRVPWHRVVADGGAIGRHPHRDAQIAKLREEGVLVAPVGIVQGLAERRISSFDDVVALPASDTPTRPSRSRGMKGAPGSTIG